MNIEKVYLSRYETRLLEIGYAKRNVIRDIFKNDIFGTLREETVGIGHEEMIP